MTTWFGKSWLQVLCCAKNENSRLRGSNDPDGIRIVPETKGETALSPVLDAQSDALSVKAIPTPPPADPELSALVAAWPSLPTAVRAGVIAMVRAIGGGT